MMLTQIKCTTLMEVELLKQGQVFGGHIQIHGITLVIIYFRNLNILSNRSISSNPSWKSDTDIVTIYLLITSPPFELVLSKSFIDKVYLCTWDWNGISFCFMNYTLSNTIFNIFCHIFTCPLTKKNKYNFMVNMPMLRSIDNFTNIENINIARVNYIAEVKQWAPKQINKFSYKSYENTSIYTAQETKLLLIL